MLATPATKQTSSAGLAVCRSLWLGGPRQSHTAVPDASALDPVTLNSPEQEVFPIDEEFTVEEEEVEEEVFPPISKFDFLAQELKAT